MTQFKTFYHIDGTKYVVTKDTCRGCWMNEHPECLPETVKPVWTDGNVIVRQDVEWPIPGFYIVSIKNHTESIADIPEDVYKKFTKLLFYTRKGMRDILRIKKAQIYHEEKQYNSHVHFWLLPIWQDIVDKYGLQPKVYEGNVKTYIDLFKYEQTKSKIILCNQKMSEYLNSIEI
ncbi:MAG: hypothetical protein II843_03630 [Alphaproteobacteria bacterium]|nr:hypothetical protein [Alphaproteobacteria bacterium]